VKRDNDIFLEVYEGAYKDLASLPCNHGLLGWLGLKKSCGICGGAEILRKVVEERKARDGHSSQEVP
jgi:hypothetical protein